MTARRPAWASTRRRSRDALDQIAAWEQPAGTTHPLYAGAVTLLGHDGRVVAQDASGYALRYADGAGTELPRDQWVPMRDDTIFDMASVTKLFTSILVLQQVERGAIRLEEPVATYLPEFAAHGKGAITVRQLLTHTSGLQPVAAAVARLARPGLPHRGRPRRRCRPRRPARPTSTATST